jgi:hypothetical protein
MGLRTAHTPTGGSSREYWAMGETLTQRRRVLEEALRGVKSFYPGTIPLLAG